MKSYRKNVEVQNDQISELEERFRLINKRVDKNSEQEIGDNEIQHNDGNQLGANTLLLTFIILVAYKIMKGTF